MEPAPDDTPLDAVEPSLEGPPVSKVRFLARLARLLDLSDKQQDEMAAFFQNHFSTEALTAFAEYYQDQPELQSCLAQAEAQVWPEWQHIHEQPEAYEEEDGLGYYEDGVKRTLTDEQIAMFRRSEIRELRRERNLQLQRAEQAADGLPELMDEASDRSAIRHEKHPSSSTRAFKKKRRGAMRPRREPKPDLRKRTWDVVEQGLDTLDYD